MCFTLRWLVLHQLDREGGMDGGWDGDGRADMRRRVGVDGWMWMWMRVRIGGWVGG